MLSGLFVDIIWYRQLGVDMVDSDESCGRCRVKRGALRVRSVSFIMGSMVPSKPRIVLELNSWQG